MAALLRPGICRALLLRPDLFLLSANYLREELIEHEGEFLEKSSRDPSSYLAAVEVILSNLHFAAKDSYSVFESEARRLSPDPDDWPFFALALSRKCGIWSNDKRLKSQAKVKVWSTEELSAYLKIG